MDKNINKEQLGRMKQKAGATKHRAGPQSTPCSLRSVLVATWQRWIGKPSTCNRAAASRTKTPSSRQGLANSSFVLCVSEWHSMEAWPLPVAPAARSWRTSRRTTYGRRRPTRTAESCRQSGSRSGRKWGRVVYHCQAANLDCILVLPESFTALRRLRRCLQSWPRGRDFGLFGQLPVHLVYNFSFQAHIVRVEDNLLKQHLYIYIYIYTHTYYIRRKPLWCIGQSCMHRAGLRVTWSIKERE